MIMPTLMVLLLWLVAGLCLLVWWQVADRVFDALAAARSRRDRAATRKTRPVTGEHATERG